LLGRDGGLRGPVPIPEPHPGGKAGPSPEAYRPS